jgi:hypothetical protein
MNHGSGGGRVVPLVEHPLADERSDDVERQPQAAELRPPLILVGTDISGAVDKAIAALAPLDIYQRGGTLVEVIRNATAEDGIVRPDGSPRIRRMPRDRLRELMGDAADWYQVRRGKDVSVAPPKDIAAAVEARGQWYAIRPLDGVVSYPVLTPLGDVLLTPGYDAVTKLIYEPSATVSLSPRPTLEQAKCAVQYLLDRVADFPFAADAHRAAYLAGLLTPVARPAIAGPTPLVLMDANDRGVGKTLLADLIGTIVLGRSLPRRTAPEESAEWRKTMLAIAIAADQIVLIDNVTTTLKADALDVVLTGNEYRDRLLGRNEELTLPVRTVFLATSNNATLSADLVRRSLHVRLEVAQEHPERRQGSGGPTCWAPPSRIGAPCCRLC